MTDKPQKQGNNIRGGKNNPPDSRATQSPSAERSASDTKSEVMTEIFLTVAKEKDHLEAVIMSQNDTIKGLEKEKEKLTLSLKKLTASHKSMREKLLDFDILRNMEISELKKKIEKLMADSRKAVSEKDAILKNLERDQKNISRFDNQVAESLIREKRELEERLRKALSEAGREEAGIEASLAPPYSTIGDPEKNHAAGEVDLLNADHAAVEEKLQQDVDDYSKEIAELKIDIDELTTAIESKINIIDTLNAKVVRLSEELSQKDRDLHDKIPELLEKINSLSRSIDTKMEENSLFAKELFDLNTKLSALNEEMIKKDELLIDISSDYKKQKDEIEALHGAHELTIRNLVDERNLLKQECEELRARSSGSLEKRHQEEQEKRMLGDKLSSALREKHEISRENETLAALLSEKDTVINDLKREVEVLQAKAQGATDEGAENLAALKEQMTTLHQQLLEKNELLNAMSAESLQNAEKGQAIANLQNELLLLQAKLDGATTEHASNLAVLREKMTLLNQQLLEKRELLTVMASERDYGNNELLYKIESLRKEKSDLDSEIQELKERGLKREEYLAEHISLFHGAQKEKAGLEEALAQAAEKTNELVLERDRLAAFCAEKDRSLSFAEAEILRLQEDIAVLRASHEEIQQKVSEKQHESAIADAEKEELQKTALEYQETFEHLKQEIILLNKNLAEKEQTIRQLLLEKDNLAASISDQQGEVDRYSAAWSDLESQLKESRREHNLSSAEENGLADAIASLQDEIKSLTMAREEEGQALQGELSSYRKAVSDLQVKLEQGLYENTELRSKLTASQSAGRKASTQFVDKGEETLPAPAEKGATTKKHSFAYALLALILFGGLGLSFYVFKAGLIPLPVQKPAAMEAVRKEWAYNDMFSMLTKVSPPADVKFQATLLTESLILKSDTPGEKALYDFQNYLYFKVSVSAPTKGLDAAIVDDPYATITLKVGAESVRPLPNMQVKNIKTFFRKEEPVSTTFYCVFPRSVLTPDRAALSLSFHYEKDRADIVWDLNVLRTDSLFP